MAQRKNVILIYFLTIAKPIEPYLTFPSRKNVQWPKKRHFGLNNIQYFKYTLYSKRKKKKNTFQLENYRMQPNHHQQEDSSTRRFEPRHLPPPPLRTANPNILNPYSTGTYTCKSFYIYGLKNFSQKLGLQATRNCFQHCAVIRSWLFL